MTQPLLQFDAMESFDPTRLVIAPSVHVQARETSGLAAIQNLPRRASQNAELLKLITEAGEAGMSDPEIQEATGLKRQTICLRRFDLRKFLRPAVRRQVIHKRIYTCWRRASLSEMAES